MKSENLASSLVSRLLDPVSRYHAHRVEGIEHVPVVGPALLVIHHSLATYDCLLLGVAVWHRTGRIINALAHDRIFEVPALGELLASIGARRASPEAGRALLAAGEVVMVAPGGMWEALRPSSERYSVRWTNRKGFVKLALETQVPMVLAACPRADDLFDVEPHPVTDWAYKRFRVPVPRLRGRRGLPVPRRVPLVHHVAPPILPPPWDPARTEEQVEDLHREAVRVMGDLLSKR